MSKVFYLDLSIIFIKMFNLMGDCVLWLLFVSSGLDLQERRASSWRNQIQKRRNKVSDLPLSHKSIIFIRSKSESNKVYSFICLRS